MKSALSEACTIKIKEFEGPFDLLFYLFEKNKINIYDIPISDITDQYMDYLSNMQKLDLEIASEFLLIAATLLYIKSKMLLPKEVKEEEKKENIDPREDLVVKLLEYKKFKELANILKDKNGDWEKVYYKSSENLEFKYEPIIYDLCPQELHDVYFKVIERNKKKTNKNAEKIAYILKVEKVSMKKTIKRIVGVLVNRVNVLFRDIFSIETNTKMEIITGFLSVLELAKIKKIKIKQEDNFRDIELTRNGDSIDIDNNWDDYE